MRALTDVQLHERVLARDSAAWTELVRRFGMLCRRAVARVAPHEEDDALGDFWLALLDHDMRRLRAWDPARNTKLGSWLFMLATNAAIERRRARRRFDRHPPPPDDEAPTVLDDLIDREERSTTADLARDLSRRQRQVFDMFYRRGLDEDDIARRLGWSVKTVYSMKFKLIERLKRAA